MLLAALLDTATATADQDARLAAWVKAGVANAQSDFAAIRGGVRNGIADTRYDATLQFGLLGCSVMHRRAGAPSPADAWELFCTGIGRAEPYPRAIEHVRSVVAAALPAGFTERARRDYEEPRWSELGWSRGAVRVLVKVEPMGRDESDFDVAVTHDLR
jgi:hypothetical protein